MDRKEKIKEKSYNKKCEIMETCYNCYADMGFYGTGLKALAKRCGFTPPNFYVYFDNIDELITQSTEHCMSKVEDEFMQLAPKDFADLERFLREVPKWTAEKHGKKYRLMYQIYTHPKYRQHGKKFFEGVNQRYSEYAKTVSENIGLPEEIVRPMIFTFVRACVHYALYEDEFYLNEQIRLIKETLNLFIEKYKK